MVNQGLVDPLFSFWLNNGGEENGGELIFGGVDNEKFTGDIHYIPVERKGYWEIPLEGVQLGGHDLHVSGKAAIDTGSST
jgi:saccharopepsin